MRLWPYVAVAARDLLARQREEEERAAQQTRLPGMEDPDAASARRLREMMGGSLARGETTNLETPYYGKVCWKLVANFPTHSSKDLEAGESEFFFRF